MRRRQTAAVVLCGAPADRPEGLSVRIAPRLVALCTAPRLV